MIWPLAFYIAFAMLVAFGLRHVSAPFQRLNDVNWQALVNLDAIGFFLAFGLLYLLGIVRICPRLGETFSSRAGWAAAEGRRIGIVASAIIDAPFWLVTSQAHHCAEAYLRWLNPLRGRSADA